MTKFVGINSWFFIFHTFTFFSFSFSSSAHFSFSVFTFFKRPSCWYFSLGKYIEIWSQSWDDKTPRKNIYPLKNPILSLYCIKVDTFYPFTSSLIVYKNHPQTTINPYLIMKLLCHNRTPAQIILIIESCIPNITSVGQNLHQKHLILLILLIYDLNQHIFLGFYLLLFILSKFLSCDNPIFKFCNLLGMKSKIRCQNRSNCEIFELILLFLG